jgi:hypothetical protein
VRRLGGTRAGALTAAALYAGFSALLVPTFVAVADPQFLAQTVSLAALFVQLGASTWAARLLGVPLLLMLSLFTKHQELAVPAAVFADMLARHHDEVRRWLLVMLALALVFIGLGYLAGSAFVPSLLAPRGYSFYALIGTTRRVIEPLQLPAAAALLWLVVGCPRRWRPLCGTFGAVALASLVVFAGGEGVTRNVGLDFIAAVAIGAGMAAALVPRRIAALVILIVGFPLGLNAVLEVGNTRAELAALRQGAAAFRREVAFLAARPGAAICEDLLLCYSAGKPLIVDPYNALQNVLFGRLDDEVLVAPVLAREVPTIQFDRPLRQTMTGYEVSVGTERRFSPAFLAAVATRYRLDHASEAGAFYVP